jgi:hypothetical protein
MLINITHSNINTLVNIGFVKNNVINALKQAKGNLNIYYSLDKSNKSRVPITYLMDLNNNTFSHKIISDSVND